MARITEWYVTGTSFLLKNPSEGEVQMGCVSTRSVNAVLVGIFHCGVGFLFNVAPPRLVWIMDGTSYSNCSARCHISPLSRPLASRYVVINVMATTGLLGGGAVGGARHHLVHLATLRMVDGFTVVHFLVTTIGLSPPQVHRCTATLPDGLKFWAHGGSSCGCCSYRRCWFVAGVVVVWPGVVVSGSG